MHTVSPLEWEQAAATSLQSVFLHTQSPHTKNGTQTRTRHKPQDTPRQEHCGVVIHSYIHSFIHSYIHSFVRLSPHSTARASTERVESRDTALAQQSLSKRVCSAFCPVAPPPLCSVPRRVRLLRCEKTLGSSRALSSVPLLWCSSSTLCLTFFLDNDHAHELHAVYFLCIRSLVDWKFTLLASH